MKTTEQQKEWNRKYYLKNREKIIARTKERYLRLKDTEEWKIKRRKRRLNWDKTPKGIYRILKSNCHKKSRKIRGIAVLISQDKFLKWYEKSPKVCYYCGVTESKFKEKVGTRLSIDRKNNEIGYTEKNIVLACGWCNQVKGPTLTEKEMLIVGHIVMKKRW